MKIEKVVIDPELASLMEVLHPTELEFLYKQLEEDGIRDPLKFAWIDGDPILVDGHNRYRWYMQFGRNGNKTQRPQLELVPGVSTITEAKLWMDSLQRGRRNLNYKQKSRLKGLRLRWQFELESERNGGVGDAKLHARLVREQAEREEQSVRQVQYDEAYSVAIEEIEQYDEAAAEKIEFGELLITQKDVIRMVKSKKIEEGILNLKSGRKWDDNGYEEPSLEALDNSSGREAGFQRAKATWNLANRSLGPLIERLQLIGELSGGRFPVPRVQIEEVSQLLSEWEPLAACDCDDGCGRCRQTGWCLRLEEAGSQS